MVETDANKIKFDFTDLIQGSRFQLLNYFRRAQI